MHMGITPDAYTNTIAPDKQCDYIKYLPYTNELNLDLSYINKRANRLPKHNCL